MNTKQGKHLTLEEQAIRFIEKLDAISGRPPDMKPLIIEGQTLCLFLYLEKLSNGHINFDGTRTTKGTKNTKDERSWRMDQ